MWVSRDGSQPAGYSHLDPDGPVLTTNYYDDYSGIPGLPGDFPSSGYSTMTKGLPTVTKTAVLNTIYNAAPDMLSTANYYDDLGRIVKAYRQHYLGGGGKLSAFNYDVFTNSYNFSNQVTRTIRRHYKNVGNVATLVVTTNDTVSYDHVGRKTQAFEQIDSGPSVLLAQTDYNEIGQTVAKHLHGATGAAPFLQDVIYKYNERGWLKRINDPAITPTATRMFAEQLNYDSVRYAAIPKYNGNITEQDYFAKDGTRQNVVYSYDPLNRLTAGNSSAGLSETGVQYDNLGNIKQLTRGTTTSIYSYLNGSSQLQSVSNITSSSYTYDFNGNAARDGRNNTTLTYNLLNLPQTVTASNPVAINLTYYYDAGGNKLRKESGASSTDYINGIQHKTDGTIDFIQTEEGRAVPISGGYEYQYTLTDHLGNNRVTFGTMTGTAAKLQADDYYPFGLDVSNWVTSPKNEYLYNGKELQPELGTYDCGWRQYDPAIARWTTPDPLAEFHFETTGYSYAMNNPVTNIDIMGLDTAKSASQINDNTTNVNSNSSSDHDKEAEYWDKHSFSQYIPGKYKTGPHKGESICGHCALQIRLGLEAGGMNTSGRPRSAKNYGPFLTLKGYKVVSRDNYTPQKGDLRVWQPYPGGNPNGHIDGWDGKQWVSDFKENPLGPGQGYRNHPDFEIYRRE